MKRGGGSAWEKDEAFSISLSRSACLEPGLLRQTERSQRSNEKRHCTELVSKVNIFTNKDYDVHG